MIISFDLDDTLFVDGSITKIEKKLNFPYDRIYKESLRLGAVNLLKKIREQRMQLWVYTSSFRSERYIKTYFRCYGIKIDRVINGKRHYEDVQKGKSEPMPSKYPSFYRIDLHVDDDPSVAQNGRTHGFRVFLIANEADWDVRLWDVIARMQQKEAAR